MILLSKSLRNLTSLSLGPPELQMFDFPNRIIKELDSSLSLVPPELQMHDFLNRTMKELDQSEPGPSRAPNV